MLQKPPKTDTPKADTDSPAVTALKCAYQIMKQRIISNPKDMTGVLLYSMLISNYDGEETENADASSYPHCYLLTDLDVLDADAVKTPKDLVEN